MFLGFSMEGWFFACVGSAIGLGTAWWGYRISRPKGAQLGIYQRSLPVLDRPSDKYLDGKVLITYAGKPVPRLSVARVTVWNCGDTTIDGSMLVSKDPLMLISHEGGEVLDVQMEFDAQLGKRGAGISLDTLCTSTANISFDFLNPMEGFTVRILHTGVDPDMKISGALKGGTVFDEGSSMGKKSSKKILVATAVQVFIPVLLSVLFIAISFTFETVKPVSLVPLFGGLLVLFISSFIFNKVGDKLLWHRIPRHILNSATRADYTHRRE